MHGSRASTRRSKGSRRGCSKNGSGPVLIDLLHATHGVQRNAKENRKENLLSHMIRLAVVSNCLQSPWPVYGIQNPPAIEGLDVQICMPAKSDQAEPPRNNGRVRHRDVRNRAAFSLAGAPRDDARRKQISSPRSSLGRVRDLVLQQKRQGLAMSMWLGKRH